jgi:hypothetical protein
MAMLHCVCHQWSQHELTVDAQQCLRVTAAIASMWCAGRAHSAMHVSAVSSFTVLYEGLQSLCAL